MSVIAILRQQLRGRCFIGGIADSTGFFLGKLRLNARRESLEQNSQARLTRCERGVPDAARAGPDLLAKTITDAQKASRDDCFRLYRRISRFLRITPIMPAKPVAINPSVPDSGTGAGGVPAVNSPCTN